MISSFLLEPVQDWYRTDCQQFHHVNAVENRFRINFGHMDFIHKE